jgi:hypothetical protein
MRVAAVLALLILAMLASTTANTTAARSEILRPIAAGLPPS